MDEVYLITASFAGKIREDFDGYVHMAREAGYQGLEMDSCCIAAAYLAKMSERRNTRFIDNNLTFVRSLRQSAYAVVRNSHCELVNTTRCDFRNLYISISQNLNFSGRNLHYSQADSPIDI